MTITTKTGKTFDCDLLLPSTDPDRLYIHIINTPLHDVAVVFTDEAKELPLNDYPEYKNFDAMNVTRSNGVHICLK